VLDAANLERNLYLTAQLFETGVRLILALNMTDVAATRGLTLNPAALAKALGAPVVLLTANKHHGIAELKAALAALPATPRAPTTPTIAEVV
jgi:Fe2+ transport system protein B